MRDCMASSGIKKCNWRFSLSIVLNRRKYISLLQNHCSDKCTIQLVYIYKTI